MAISRWVQSGDFSTLTQEQAVKRQVEYTFSSEGSYIKNMKISLLDYGDNEFEIVIDDYDIFFFKECQKQQLVENCYRGGLEHNASFLIYNYPIKLKTKELNKLKGFLLQIDNYHPSHHVIEVSDNIHLCLGLRKAEEIVAQEVSLLTEDGKFEEAIKKAKEYQDERYYEIIWELAEAIHQDLNHDTLIELYQTISPQNPHYGEAEERLFILNDKPSNETEYLKYFEKQLMLASQTNNQTLIDQSFHQLCGYTGLTPKINQLKADGKTLIAIAGFIRDLNIKISSIKEKVKDSEKIEMTSDYFHTDLQMHLMQFKEGLELYYRFPHLGIDGLIDLPFFTICGLEDYRQMIRNIRGEFQTLSTLALEMRKLNIMYLELKKKIDAEDKNDYSIENEIFNELNKAVIASVLYEASSNLVFFKKCREKYVIEHRHEHPDLQHEYDVQFGLVKK